MKIQGFLDHLLKSAGGNSNPGAPATGGLGGMLNADFGKGALAGGALGLLLGKNKSTRKLATYGGLAAVGVMAYKAYGDYKQQQAGTVCKSNRRPWIACRRRKRNCTARPSSRH